MRAVWAGEEFAMKERRDTVYVRLPNGQLVTLKVSIDISGWEAGGLPGLTPEDVADLIRLAMLDAELEGFLEPRGRDGRS
jgi:hypothetical protein